MEYMPSDPSGEDSDSPFGFGAVAWGYGRGDSSSLLKLPRKKETIARSGEMVGPVGFEPTTKGL